MRAMGLEDHSKVAASQQRAWPARPCWDASGVLPSSYKTAGRLLLLRACVAPANNDDRVPSWSGLAEDGFQRWRGRLLQQEGGVILDPAQQDTPHLRTKLG